MDDTTLLPTGDEAGSAPEDRAFRPDVEGLRAFAILLVVLFHVDTRGIQGGFAGVDVFFVVSGFVITGLLLRERQSTGKTSLARFYARRARRILPAAIVVILVSLVATDLLIGANVAVLVASDARWTAIFLGNFHFESVTPSLFTKRPGSPLAHMWTLAIEEQFYLVYPAFFVALVSIPGKWFGSARARLGCGLTVVIVSSFIASVVTSHVVVLAAYYSPFTRAWELALGGLVAVSTRQLAKLPSAVAALATWIGLAGVIASGWVVSLHIAYPGYAAALPVCSTALVIAGGCAAPLAGAEVLLRLPPLRWLGRWSYSWYLWHWPVLTLAASYAHTSVSGTSVVKNAILAVLTLPLAAGSYFLLENPIRHSKRLVDNPRATIIGAIALIAVCVAVTYAF
jgi:peptidoglycan/LPS O-acetylase OafA/YrhL